MVDRINETEAKWLFVLDAMYPYMEAALPETCVENVVIVPATNSIHPVLSKLMYIRGEATKIVRQGNGRQRFLRWKDFCTFSRDFTGSPDVPYQPDTPTVMVYSSGSFLSLPGSVLSGFAAAGEEKGVPEPGLEEIGKIYDIGSNSSCAYWDLLRPRDSK